MAVKKRTVSSAKKVENKIAKKVEWTTSPVSTASTKNVAQEKSIEWYVRWYKTTLKMKKQAEELWLYNELEFQVKYVSHLISFLTLAVQKFLKMNFKSMTVKNYINYLALNRKKLLANNKEMKWKILVSVKGEKNYKHKLTNIRKIVKEIWQDKILNMVKNWEKADFLNVLKENAKLRPIATIVVKNVEKKLNEYRKIVFKSKKVDILTKVIKETIAELTKTWFSWKELNKLNEVLEIIINKWTIWIVWELEYDIMMTARPRKLLIEWVEEFWYAGIRTTTFEELIKIKVNGKVNTVTNTTIWGKEFKRNIIDSLLAASQNNIKGVKSWYIMFKKLIEEDSKSLTKELNKLFTSIMKKVKESNVNETIKEKAIKKLEKTEEVIWKFNDNFVLKLRKSKKIVNGKEVEERVFILEKTTDWKEPAKKEPAKKTTVKKESAKKTTDWKEPVKKESAKKTTDWKEPVKKESAKKTTVKKESAKKTTKNKVN